MTVEIVISFLGGLAIAALAAFFIARSVVKSRVRQTGQQVRQIRSSYFPAPAFQVLLFSFFVRVLHILPVSHGAALLRTGCRITSRYPRHKQPSWCIRWHNARILYSFPSAPNRSWQNPPAESTLSTSLTRLIYNILRNTSNNTGIACHRQYRESTFHQQYFVSFSVQQARFLPCVRCRIPASLFQNL